MEGIIQMISVSEVASSSNLSKQSIFNNLKALDVEIVKHKNISVTQRICNNC